MSQHEATQQEKYKAQSEEHKLQVEQLKAGALREQNQAELERRKHQHEMDMKKVQYQGKNRPLFEIHHRFRSTCTEKKRKGNAA